VVTARVIIAAASAGFIVNSGQVRVNLKMDARTRCGSVIR
jgi:hypothetical protein